jgi:signal transduction histidine kinase
VIVADVLNHPYWAKAKRLVSRTPMRACWSEPIITHGGEVLGSFAIYYDEPREPVAEELNLITSAASLAAIAISYKKNQQVLRDLDRAKDEFISIAAHELRTPITAVIGYTDLLLEETDPSTIRDYVSEIAVQGDMLARLVDDLLDVSLIQIGRGLTINMKSTAIVPLVQRVITQLGRSHPDRRIELECSESVPERISCDPGRISQVIENLISNGLKFSAPEEPVAVQISATEDAVRISVTDNGIGMSDDAVRHAFDKFYRADYSYTAPRGLGMGLCIAQRIVDAHGGEITLKSRQGEGATVSVTLPLQVCDRQVVICSAG